MAYNTSGIIEADDYNNFIGTTTSTNVGTNTDPANAAATDVNAVWGPGSGDLGYGQTALTQVVGGSDPTTSSDVTAAQWSGMLNAINAMRQHQGAAAPYSAGQIPTTGDIISVVSDIQTNINSCGTDRLSFGASGTTVNGSNTTLSLTLDTSSPDSANTNAVATWASAAEMRYFFNCGGQIRFRIVSATNSDGDSRGTTVASWLSSNLNAVTVRARATSYSGTAYATWGTGRGRYDLSSGAASTIFKYEPAGTYGTTDSVRLNLTANGDANGATTLTFNLYVAATRGPNNVGAGTGSPTQATADAEDTSTVTIVFAVDYISPSTTYLTQSWGVPTIS